EVELDARDAAHRAGHLEVHVAEVVFVSHDVGEEHKAVAFLDEADGDAGDRIADGYASVHERERAAAHAGHAARTVRLGDIGDHANRVREFIDTGDDGFEAALGQGAVADFTPARPADRLALADAVGWEVVIQHELFAVLVGQAIHALLVAGRAERGGDQ